MNKMKIKNELLAIIACFFWATAFFNVKIGLKYANPLFFAGVRFIISGLLLLPFCGNISKYFFSIKKNYKIVLILAFFQTFILYSLFFIGMKIVSGALGAIIIGSSPLFAGIVAHIVMDDDKLDISKIISILIGITGIVIISISKQPWSNKGLKEFIGVIFLVLGCIGSAIGNTIVAKDKKNINPIVLNSSQMFIGGVLLFIISLIFEDYKGLIGFPLRFYIALIWLSSISAVSFSIWFILLKRPGVKVSRINLWKFIIPVFGAIMSWIILSDESPDMISIIGMLFVGASIISFNLKNIKRKKIL